MSFKFQVNLRGIITLLSDHLYTSPDVFVRELLQNAVDAITARGAGTGHIDVSVVGERTIVFEDDGVGLTEAEVHTFLATIGQSSKGELLERSDFIGRFGIGLLSCFLVADEIALTTRSAHGDATVVWRGRHDGTYTLEATEEDRKVGTEVCLVLREDSLRYANGAKLEALLMHFGMLLPWPIRVGGRQINTAPPAWRAASPTDDALLAYGEHVFSERFLDALPLHLPHLGIEGVAYVLADPASAGARPQHRVFLKGMFLTDRGEGLFPEWAFFLRCIVNATNLRPNAARDAFYPDELLQSAQEELGVAVRSWLLQQSRVSPERMQRILTVHRLGITALCVHDDEALRTFAPLLTFETSLGTMTLGECLEQGKPVRYVPSVGDFRQIAAIAAAQDMLVLNGGYVYLADLLDRFGGIERVEAADLAQTLSEPNRSDRDACAELLRVATEALEPFDCTVALKRFDPVSLPMLYTSHAETERALTAKRTAESSSELFAALIGDLQSEVEVQLPELFINAANPLVQRLAALASITNSPAKLVVETLYVQALLLAQRPLSSRDLLTLNRGLLGLIERAVDTETKGWS